MGRASEPGRTADLRLMRVLCSSASPNLESGLLDVEFEAEEA
jgi:hypothetical protein